MSAYLMIIAVLLPILGGLLTFFLPFKKGRIRNIYVEIVVIITSVLAFMLLFNPPADAATMIKFTEDLTISFRLDDTGRVFTFILAFLWPLATLYAFEYMEHEERQAAFFGFYTMTYGVTLGIAMAEGIFTMYFFYEFLTLMTIPLVIHTLSKEAIRATVTYMLYSLGGAAFAFVGMLYLLTNSTTPYFTAGGMLDEAAVAGNINLLCTVFVLAFCGFSVKAAMFPFSGWLPKAGVAPTPVTALLHAVAVVKSGAFACIRLTYYCFGTELLAGTWAQNLLMVLIMITIVYGCSRALKETHFKRRLAWSTVSNLSYILFGVIMMSPLGLVGALSHMICHAFMKICSFFCAGAVMHKADKNFVHELDGLGHRMPAVFMIFTLSGMALMGVPGLAGFVSKWNLVKSAVVNSNHLAYFGVAAILISALLTAIYMLTVSVRAFFPGRDFDFSKTVETKDPGPCMMIPLCIFVVVIVFIGLNPTMVTNILTDVASTAF